MPGNHTFFSGSSVFKPLADEVGFRVDQINFLMCQLLSFPTSLFLYHCLSPRKVSPTVRLVFHFVIGLSICLFCFGLATKHLVSDALVAYVIMRWGPSRHAHRLVFITTMSYLSVIHFYRAYFTPSYRIDITGPMMVLTQKLTSLAFSIHDGKVKERKELTVIQKRERVQETPNTLQFLAYALSYQGILCGPLCFYSDFIAFIEGRHYSLVEKRQRLNNNNNEIVQVEPTPWIAVTEKLGVACCLLAVSAVIVPMYPVDGFLDTDRGFFGKLWYLTLSLTLMRCHYYYAWIMSDAICNAAGFGFNGFASDGQARWDLISNVKIWEFETATSWKECLEAWNCTTVYWLRRVAYERTSPRYRTLATYLLSAWWHGFFPGYYLTFVTGALFTATSRTVRRLVRPYFVTSTFKKRVYDAVTFIAVKLAVTYVGITFVLLHIMDGLRAYKALYFFMHIACIVIFGLATLLPKKPVRKEAL